MVKRVNPRPTQSLFSSGWRCVNCTMLQGFKPLFAADKFPANVSTVSVVELAVRKVKKLSDRRARELLGWLAKRQPNGSAQERQTQASRRKSKAPVPGDS